DVCSSDLVAHMIGRKVVAQAQRLLAKKFVAETEIFDGGGGHGSVGNGQQGAFGSPQASGAQADVFHGSNLIVDFAGVPHLHRFVKKNGDASKQILERFLCTESDG